MKTYIVLFRGINVGGKNLVPMKVLVPLLENSGFEKVKSYINSGNIILCSQNEPTEKIKQLVRDNFNCAPEVMTLTAEHFKISFQKCPYNDYEGKLVHFYFCQKTPQLNHEKLKQVQAVTEQFHLDEKVFYLYAPEGIGRSKLVSKAEVCLNTKATARNLNTVKKIISIIESIDL